MYINPFVKYKEGALSDSFTTDSKGNGSPAEYETVLNKTIDNAVLINYNTSGTTGLMFRFNYVKFYLGYRLRYHFNPMLGENTNIVFRTKPSSKLSTDESGSIRSLSIPNLHFENGIVLGLDVLL